jgi:nucleotide-binding universal stress UspA family protein
MSSAALTLDIPKQDVGAPVGNGPIVVATDGSLASDAALCFAAHLEARTSATVLLLSVVEPVTVLPFDYGISLPFLEMEQAQRQARIAKLTSQLDRLGLRSAGWQVTLEFGDPVTRIADMARASDAAVVITGLGKHELFDRILGSETALGTLRLSRVPILAVAEHLQALPQVAVIATDFSVASLDAARTALRLFPTCCRVVPAPNDDARRAGIGQGPDHDAGGEGVT